MQILCLVPTPTTLKLAVVARFLRLAEQYSECVFHWVVFSAIGVREAEARSAATLFAGSARLKEPLLKAFPDGFMPFVGAEVKAVFEELKQTVSPDLIFTHNS